MKLLPGTAAAAAAAAPPPATGGAELKRFPDEGAVFCPAGSLPAAPWLLLLLLFAPPNAAIVPFQLFAPVRACRDAATALLLGFSVGSICRNGHERGDSEKGVPSDHNLSREFVEKPQQQQLQLLSDPIVNAFTLRDKKAGQNLQG